MWSCAWDDKGMPNIVGKHKCGFVIHLSSFDMAASDLAIEGANSAISIRHLPPGAFAALEGAGNTRPLGLGRRTMPTGAAGALEDRQR
jgi:hypothetical protein